MTTQPLDDLRQTLAAARGPLDRPVAVLSLSLSRAAGSPSAPDSHRPRHA